jgi:MGT family glycosyltransferase
MNSIRSLGRPKMNKIFKTYKKYCKKLVYFFKQLPLKYKIKFTISNLINYRISDEEFNSFVAPVNDWMEIISCPKDFDYPDVKRNSNVHYIGPCIRNRDLDESLFKLEKDNNKEIIFVCLGSQTARIYKTCETFFLKIFELMAKPEMKSIRVILSMGSKFETEKFGNIPANVSLYEWIPQIEALKISSAAIIHGCIYYGVPMIVLPDKYDQPANAQRIEFHGLGVRGDLENISVDDLKLLVNKILNDSIIKDNVTRMQNIFRNKEEQQEGALLIEEYYQINAKQFAPVDAY